ncbi:hypothetical protein DFP72DRAFT_876004 [Ephemerocybe angulata]|uniref:F-box domain-containing protein n=1 Tax=Ephemerocybe angulata TaxID=980116 RepID=A0A8H6IDY2_9AGAR|nr:hypothetical protein DFP72DRAFT_876004 [Tulosesus angulatus]
MQRQASATARGLIIADFSPEILAIIFALALVDTPGDPATLGRIATVCTQWKNVLYSHPRFWTSLRLSLRALFVDSVVNISRWETMIFRTQPSSNIHESWIHSLLVQASMVEDEPAWPNLRSLEIRTDRARFREYMSLAPLILIAPALERLHVHLERIMDPYFMRKPFDGLDLKFYLLVFSLGVHLESLTIKDYHECCGDDAPDFPSPTPFGILSSLRHLEIWDNAQTRHCLQRSNFPALSSLSLHASDDCSIWEGNVVDPSLSAVVLGLIKRSGCRLKRVSTSNTTLFDEPPAWECQWVYFAPWTPLKSWPRALRAKSYGRFQVFANSFHFQHSRRCCVRHLVRRYHTLVRRKALVPPFKAFVEDPRRWGNRTFEGVLESAQTTQPRGEFPLESAKLVINEKDDTTTILYHLDMLQGSREFDPHASVS